MTEPHLDAHRELDALLKAIKAAIDAITFDDSGVNGQGGNGGMLSRETIRKVDELRIAQSRFERSLRREVART